jgi:hypothetical protein
VDPRAGLDALNNRIISRLRREWNPDSSATQTVAPLLVPTEIPRLHDSETESVSNPLGLDYIPLSRCSKGRCAVCEPYCIA